MRDAQLFLSLVLLLFSLHLQAFELEIKQVTEKVYALVGDIDQRTKENLGLNNTLGFVVTDEGVVLVGSGGWGEAAKLIEQAVKKVTTQPIKMVVNTGSQDHHWMGNGYFIEQNIPVVALKTTVESQTAFTEPNLQRLATALEKQPSDLSPVIANEVVAGDTKDFTLGGADFSLRYLGEAHFPGDAVLWLPKEKVLFSGDIVFNDRMLGLLPQTSDVKAWQSTFRKMAELDPTHLIPGHGYPGDLATAQKSTGDYLDWLVSEVGKAIEEMEDLGETVARLSESHQFEYLKFHKEWNGRNIHQTYMQLESE